MSKLSHGQEIALNHHLTEYPIEVSFEHIIDMIKDKDEEITLWFPFEGWELDKLIAAIESLANAIDRAIVDSHKEE